MVYTNAPQDGHVIPAVGDNVSMMDFVEEYKHLTNKEVKYVELKMEQFTEAIKGKPGFDMLVDTYTWIATLQPRDITATRLVYKGVRSLQEWMRTQINLPK